MTDKLLVLGLKMGNTKNCVIFVFPIVNHPQETLLFEKNFKVYLQCCITGV